MTERAKAIKIITTDVRGTVKECCPEPPKKGKSIEQLEFDYTKKNWKRIHQLISEDRMKLRQESVRKG